MESIQKIIDLVQLAAVGKASGSTIEVRIVLYPEKESKTDVNEEIRRQNSINLNGLDTPICDCSPERAHVLPIEFSPDDVESRVKTIGHFTKKDYMLQNAYARYNYSRGLMRVVAQKLNVLNEPRYLDAAAWKNAISEILGVTLRTANNNLLRMVRYGLLKREARGRSFFYCPEIEKKSENDEATEKVEN